MILPYFWFNASFSSAVSGLMADMHQGYRRLKAVGAVVVRPKWPTLTPRAGTRGREIEVVRRHLIARRGGPFAYRDTTDMAPSPSRAL